MMSTEISIKSETGVINPESYFSYQIGNVPKLDDMSHEKTLSDILVSESNLKPLKALLLALFAKYLSTNIKSRTISNDFGYKLLLDFFIDECKNLEIQEIEYIFKSGVMGRFGQIYNDISIDTICGKNGWVETYYSEHRKLRKEPTIEDKLIFTGKEMTLEQFYQENPQYKERSELMEMFKKARVNQCNVSDLKNFYKLKKYSVGEMQEDLAAISKEYYNSEIKEHVAESEYIKNWLNKFILSNYNKKKSL